jgi:hypothetical protein
MLNHRDAVMASSAKPGITVRKLDAIAMIYFPQFMTNLAELDVLSYPYELWMLEAAPN